MDSAGDIPKPNQERNQPEQRAHAAQGSNPVRPIRRINLYEFHFNAFLPEQARQLPRLVGHPSGRGRQRSYQAYPHPFGIQNSLSPTNVLYTSR